jgi:hypothetical protein
MSQLTIEKITAPTGPKWNPLQMDPNGIQVVGILNGFCSECTVLYGKASLYYKNGTKAGVLQGVYEHHIVVVDMNKRTFPFYFCEGQKGFLGTFPAAGFIVSGNDEAANYYTTPDGKFKSGYSIGKWNTMTLQAELVNYLQTPQEVYIVTEYEYIPRDPTYNDASVSLFSVTGCGFPDYHAPKDQLQYNATSAAVKSPMDGHIINASKYINFWTYTTNIRAEGHLHDGGVNIILTVNGKTVCDSHAKYELDANLAGSIAPNGKPWQVITEMEQCTTPVPIKKGDVLQMTAYYDNGIHPPRHAADGHSGEADEMGVFFINFAASSKQ